ncbi:autotransporter outer membrane beta-barrel domain-containing protein [Rhodopseudomonas sp. P2A-2r]|nr:autotransporter outer membrane beta-barrel domain-containing protein [Rhodopseudomonas sp. P2A-2r]
MRSTIRNSQTDSSGGKFARALALGFVIGLGLAPASALAQGIRPPPPVVTPPVIVPGTPPLVVTQPAIVPVPSAADSNARLSAGIALTDVGNNFLRRLGNQATWGFNKALRTNAGGGGGSEATEAPGFRTWAEAYGVTANTGAVGDFVGDKRNTAGGVVGFGARVMPGVNLGLSVDQSRTSIDVPLALQSATLDLTQVGFNAAIDKGVWTWAIALVHGSGRIDSRRDTGLGFATAGYNARIDGVLTELSYFWSLGQGRIVPKVAFEYVHSSTDALQEFGGLDPVAATGATAERSRVLVGAEIGHYWIVDQKIFDLSAYGKFVDNVSQRFSPVTVSLGTETISIQGIGESRYGADAGASASLSLTGSARLYVNYDGKLRSAAQSHQGTIGIEFKW